RERFILEDQLFVHQEAKGRQEEPFALTTVSGILATTTGLGPESLPCLGNLDFDRLQSFLGLADRADRGRFGNSGDEPVALVVTAKELALFLAFTDKEQQVTVSRLHVEDGDLGLGVAGDLEELALAVGPQVQREGAGRTATRSVSGLESCADAG